MKKTTDVGYENKNNQSTVVAQVKLEQIICNGFIKWNANYVDFHIKLMGQTYGNEGAPPAKEENLTTMNYRIAD